LQSVASVKTLSTNRLYHVAAVVFASGSNTIVKLFIDGQYDNYAAFAIANLPRTSDLPTVGWKMNGEIDEILFEGEALSIDQDNVCLDLKNRYEAEANPPGLVGDWRFDKKNPTDNKIYDPISFNNGTLNSSSGFYEEWGPNMPVEKFNGEKTVTIAASGSPSYPPDALRNLGGAFCIEAHFKSPETQDLKNLVSRAGASSNG